MPNTRPNLDDIFTQALKAACKAYERIWKGELGGQGFHRIHIETDGKVTETFDASGETRSVEEGLGKVPHELTLWVIPGNDPFEPDLILGDDYFLAKKEFMEERALADADESNWEDADQAEFRRRCVAIALENQDQWPYPFDREEKRSELEKWSRLNLI